MELIAHRGFAGVHPENTLEAFREASEVADAVEFDVRRCRSGEPVVIHDETVDRVTDGTGPVAGHTLPELRELDVLETGAGVPTLGEALDVVPPDVWVDAELKDPVVERSLELLSATDSDVLVSSFDADVLAEVRAVDPSVDRALLTWPGEDDPVERAVDLGCVAVHPEQSTVREDGILERAHDRGLVVNAWTVREAEAASALRAAGVDGVVADSPDLL